MLTVHLCHDQSVVRKGLINFLSNCPDVVVNQESYSSCGLLQANRGVYNSDITIISLQIILANELDIRRIKEILSTKVLVLGDFSDHLWWLDERLEAADGYIFEDTTPEEIIFAVGQLSSGLRSMSSEMAFLTRRVAPARTINKNYEIAISRREHEILNLIAEGLTNQEIADKIFTSKRTVEGHRQNLLNKTGSKNTATLIRYAVTNALVN